MIFFDIFTATVLPVFILLGVGVIADKFFTLDIQTLSKLNFYVFSPAIVFSMLYNSTLAPSIFFSIGGFVLLYSLVMFLIGLAIYSLSPLKPRRDILLLGTIFYNAGNYGIPLITLAFGIDAISILAAILVTQALLVNTIGIIVANSGQAGLRASILKFFQYPMIYAIGLALLMRLINLPLANFLSVPIEHLVGGFISVALIMLGAQLSRSEIWGNFPPVSVMAIVRLLISPAVTFGLLMLFDFRPEVERVLFVASGLPVAVNVYMLAAEFDNRPNFASRIVFWTTLISAVTIPTLLAIARQVF